MKIKKLCHEVLTVKESKRFNYTNKNKPLVLSTQKKEDMCPLERHFIATLQHNGIYYKKIKEADRKYFVASPWRHTIKFDHTEERTYVEIHYVGFVGDGFDYHDGLCDSRSFTAIVCDSMTEMFSKMSRWNIVKPLILPKIKIPELMVVDNHNIYTRTVKKKFFR